MSPCLSLCEGGDVAYFIAHLLGSPSDQFCGCCCCGCLVGVDGGQVSQWPLFAGKREEAWPGLPLGCRTSSLSLASPLFPKPAGLSSARTCDTSSTSRPSLARSSQCFVTSDTLACQYGSIVWRFFWITLAVGGHQDPLDLPCQV